MLYQIISLVLDVAVGLVCGACLLRLYMQQQRIPMSARTGNPVGPFLFALTDWLVLPLRRVLPTVASLDVASLLSALLVQLAQYLLLWLLQGATQGMGVVLVLALFGLLRVAISGVTGLVMIYALLSWVQARSPVSDLLDRLVAPLLSPIRRHLPLMGGVDLSPLALLVLLQVASLLTGALQSMALMAVA
ncbi:MAG: YggT family protein [Betaproteobacteria bacterium]